MLTAIIAAFAICTFHTSIALIITARAFRKKEMGNFNKIYLSSLVIRFFLMIGITWAGIIIFKNDYMTFALSILIFTFLLLFVEILYIHFRSNSLNLQNHFNK